MLSIEELRKRIPDGCFTEEEITQFYQLASILVDDYLKKKRDDNGNRTANRSE